MTSDLLIIGGGFAACSAFAWLAEFAPSNLKITLLAGLNGPNGGLAYGGNDPIHLLNAQHANMGLLEAEPDAFSVYLAAKTSQKDVPRFVSRSCYGDFLQEQWQISFRKMTRKGVQVSVHHRDAVEILSLTADEITILDDQRHSYTANGLLICEGPKLAQYSNQSHPRLISPAWPNGLEKLQQASGHVVIVGTGLSGIDAVLSALDQSQINLITMVSGNGCLPKAHNIEPQVLADVRFSGSPLDVFRALRSAAKTMPWQSVMDALRHQSNDLWSRWSVLERRNAMRIFSNIWTAHRNRLPPEIMTRIDQAQGSRRLIIIKGRASVEADKVIGMSIRLLPSETIVKPDWLVDARGFVRIDASSNTVCGRALAAGHLTLADMGYGVRADKHHRATPLDVAPIHVVGAARMGDLIETTGAPEVHLHVRQSLEGLFS